MRLKEGNLSTTVFTYLFFPPGFIECLLCASQTIGNKKTVLNFKELMTQGFIDVNQAVRTHECTNAHGDRYHKGKNEEKAKE